jgi:hypothetical protein
MWKSCIYGRASVLAPHINAIVPVTRPIIPQLRQLHVSGNVSDSSHTGSSPESGIVGLKPLSMQTGDGTKLADRYGHSLQHLVIKKITKVTDVHYFVVSSRFTLVLSRCITVTVI